MTKVILTGASGFLGRHTKPILDEHYGPLNVKALCSADYDLMDIMAVHTMLETYKPDVVVHLAAYSGGIGANKAYPADFYFRNTILTANMFEAAAKHKVQKIVYPMGGCSYPASATSPIDESQLWNGYPQAESAGYSTAKMMGIVASRSYKTQYGLDSTVIIPGNMYGEYDNFSAENSHVIAAMIRRYYEVQQNNIQEVKMWGSGLPERDFVYALDVAKTIPYFIDYYDKGPINVSSGIGTSIKELAEEIASLVNFTGNIEWDRSKPDGQMVKIFNIEMMKNEGLTCNTPLHQGLKNTIAWFSSNYSQATDGLRL